MARTAILAVKVIGDASGASRALDQTGKSATKMGGRLQSASRAATVVGGALIGVAVAANKQASELQQANGAAQAVFGSQAKSVQNLAKTAAKSLGIARSEYTQTAAVVGSQLKNMGVAQSQLIPKTDALIRLGGDLAATYGGKTSEAVAALSSLMRGETDPIERYGVSIKQADIAAQLAAKGQDKLTGAALKTAKAEALMTLLMKQTSAAQGQRAREAGSFAQQQEDAIASAKDAGAAFGFALLPIFTSVATMMASIATYASDHNREFTIGIAVVAGLSAAVFAANLVYKSYLATLLVVKAATIVYRNAQLALNLAMMANPIGLIIAAVLLLVAGFVLLYKNSETFRKIIGVLGLAGQVAIQWIIDKVTTLWQWLSAKLGPAVTTVKDLIVKGFEVMVLPITVVVDAIKDLIGWIEQIDFPSPPKWVSELFGRGGPPPAGYLSSSRVAYSGLPGRGGPGDGLFTSRISRAGGGAQIINITVNGALDPNSVARQIEQLLMARGRRLGRAT